MNAASASVRPIDPPHYPLVGHLPAYLGAAVKLALELPDRAVAGEQVSGAIRVEEGGESRSITLTVAFHEETRDYFPPPPFERTQDATYEPS